MKENKTIFEYQIAGKKYTQQPVVLGQLRQLTELLNGVAIDMNAGTFELTRNLGCKLPEAIAIVLKAADQNLKDKDIHKLANELEFDMAPETSLKIVEDFFFCNPIASLVERFTGMIKKITKEIVHRLR